MTRLNSWVNSVIISVNCFQVELFYGLHVSRDEVGVMWIAPNCSKKLLRLRRPQPMSSWLAGWPSIIWFLKWNWSLCRVIHTFQRLMDGLTRNRFTLLNNIDETVSPTIPSLYGYILTCDKINWWIRSKSIPLIPSVSPCGQFNRQRMHFNGPLINGHGQQSTERTASPSGTYGRTKRIIITTSAAKRGTRVDPWGNCCVDRVHVQFPLTGWLHITVQVRKKF